MGYYTRILTPSNAWIPVTDLQAAMRAKNLQVQVSVEAGSVEQWLQLVIKNQYGEDLFILERNEVFKEGLGAEEIEEFIEDLEDGKPIGAARWLQYYLTTIQTIYAFQHLSGSDTTNGREVLEELQAELWSRLGGIFQADSEGFSNEDGYHILWQFNEDAKGLWKMAVKTPEGHWARFEMDLGNSEHRAAFLAGSIPAGCRLID